MTGLSYLLPVSGSGSLRRADAFAFGAWDAPAPLLGAVAHVVGRKSLRRLESGSPRVVRGVERIVRKLRHIAGLLMLVHPAR